MSPSCVCLLVQLVFLLHSVATWDVPYASICCGDRKVKVKHKYACNCVSICLGRPRVCIVCERTLPHELNFSFIFTDDLCNLSNMKVLVIENGNILTSLSKSKL